MSLELIKYESGEDYISEKEDIKDKLTIDDISRYPSQEFVDFEDFIDSCC